MLSGLGQFKADVTTAIPEGGSTPENTVVFKGTVAHPNGDRVKLEAQLREITQAFISTPDIPQLPLPLPGGPS